MNDTSAVVAAGFAYSHDAGTIATIVKLTRTTLIIPLVIGFGLLVPWFEERRGGEGESLARRVYQAIPVFIILFVLASLLNTLGLIGQFGPTVQLVGRWVLVVALAAVGLQGHWRAFAGAGARPLLLGLTTWVSVAVTSLAIQTLDGFALTSKPMKIFLDTALAGRVSVSASTGVLRPPVPLKSSKPLSLPAVEPSGRTATGGWCVAGRRAIGRRLG